MSGNCLKKGLHPERRALGKVTTACECVCSYFMIRLELGLDSMTLRDKS